jgi:hypothetical protein
MEIRVGDYQRCHNCINTAAAKSPRYLLPNIGATRVRTSIRAGHQKTVLESAYRVQPPAILNATTDTPAWSATALLRHHSKVYPATREYQETHPQLVLVTRKRSYRAAVTWQPIAAQCAVGHKTLAAIHSGRQVHT